MIAIWFEAVYSSILYHWLDSWGLPPSDKPVAPSVTMHCGLQNQTDINYYYSIKFNDPLKKSIQVKVSIWPTRLPHHICRTIQICNFLVFHYPTLPVKKKKSDKPHLILEFGLFFFKWNKNIIHIHTVQFKSIVSGKISQNFKSCDLSKGRGTYVDNPTVLHFEYDPWTPFSSILWSPFPVSPYKRARLRLFHTISIIEN